MNSYARVRLFDICLLIAVSNLSDLYRMENNDGKSANIKGPFKGGPGTWGSLLMDGMPPHLLFAFIKDIDAL